MADETAGTTSAPEPPIIELRIHGVGGSKRKSMLGEQDASPLTGDATETSGLWAWKEPVGGVTRQAYLWGRYQHYMLGLWIVLLPFTLVNVAGWTLASGAASRTASAFETWRRRTGAVLARYSVALLGIALTAGWTLWIVDIVGDGLAISAAPSRTTGALWAVGAVACLGIAGYLWARTRFNLQRRPRSPVGVWLTLAAMALFIALANWSDSLRWVRAFALAASAAATAVPFALAGSNRKQFEQYRARLGGTGVARERRRLADEETLGAPCFYDHPTDSAALLLGHLIVSAAVIAVVAIRALWPESTVTSDQRLADTGAAGTPFLAHALIGVGVIQMLLVALLAVAGALGTSRASAGRNDSGVNALVNALRPASLAGIGVFLFGAAMGSLDWLVAGPRGEGSPTIDKFPQLELVPATVVGALAAALIVAVAAVCVFGRHDNKPPATLSSKLSRSWRLWRTIRWVVGEADRLIVTVGLAITAPAFAYGIWHRRGAEGTDVLLPHGAFQGPEQWASHVIGAVGLLALAVPLIVAGAAVFLPGVRSPVSSVWDVLSFWPRRFHPLGVPPEAERTVPEVQAHVLETLEDPAVRLAIVAHSQGSVIAFAALVGLRDRGALARIDLVTFGSPLFALYPRMFPAQVSPTLTDELATALPDVRWMNLWRPTDYFGIVPDHPRTDARLPTSKEIGALEPADEPTKVLAHSDYWGAVDVTDCVEDREADLRNRPVPPWIAPMASFAPKRRMVSWLDPSQLAQTAYQAGVSTVFGKWADARHLAGLLPASPDKEIITLESSPDLWIDYVADLGDGFVPTVAVALALSQPQLELQGHGILKRGHVLVMGGDEVYPTASLTAYANQLVGPYELASRSVADDDPSTALLVALPGNHDWYDGLASFTETFCAQRRIGRWVTQQERSYWAVQLTHGTGTGPARVPSWWLWGVDLQLDNVLDSGQRAYFEKASERLAPGDLVILCSPVPTWAHREPTAFDVLSEFVEQHVSSRPGVRVALHLSGDWHHYSRYERQEITQNDKGDREVAPSQDGFHRVQHVTAGGGGAFTSPTHHLAQTIDRPVPYHQRARTLSLRPQEDGPVPPGAPRRRTRFPEKGQSIRLVLTNLRLLRFIRQNQGLLVLLGGAAALAVYAALVGRKPLDSTLHRLTFGETAGAMASSTITVIVMLIMVAAWIGFAKPAPAGGAVPARFAGLVHGALQVLALVAVAWAVPRIGIDLRSWLSASARSLLQTSFSSWVVGLFDRVTLVIVSVFLGGAAGMAILAAYLTLTNLTLGMHDNEASSAVASTTAKHFVRLHIQGGEATAWVVEVADVDRAAGPFSGHDPRPLPVDDLTPSAGGVAPGPKVTVLDWFSVGRRQKSDG